MGRRKDANPLDAFDYVEMYAFEAIKELEARGARITLDIMMETIKQAIRTARADRPQTCYIRGDNPKEREAYILWEQLKHGDMKMCEIYAYIERQTDTPAATVEKYIARFRLGYDPTKPRYEDVLKAR